MGLEMERLMGRRCLGNIMDEGLKMWQEKAFACDVDLTSVTEEGKKQKQTRKLSALMLV